MLRKLFISLLPVLYFQFSMAQSTQVIKGTVTDKNSSRSLEFVQITIPNTRPVLSTFTDSLGNYVLKNVPLGRYDIEVSLLGYNKAIIREIVISAGKQSQLNIELLENPLVLNEITVNPALNKQKALNSFSSVSARMLSVEEASRYAGGFDDPARLASAFAGVASNSGSNGIIVRGNTPRLLQWRMEGVEIPSPNHFNDLRAFGGGVLTALSSQMLANSDFYTGAFPAEYSNAISGVFDMNLRKGNNEKTERTIQLGLIGLEASQEGPFKKGGKATYVFNYRYSTLGLLAPVLPDGAETIKYQDLSYKLNFPTKKAGTFSFWGIGLIDGANSSPKKDTIDRLYYDDFQKDDIIMKTGAIGLNHKLFLKNNAYFQTVLASTANETTWQTKSLDVSEQLQPSRNINNINWDYSLTSFFNKKFGKRHTNRTGIKLRYMSYNLKLNKAERIGDNLLEIVNARDNSALSSAFTNSSINLTNKLKLIAGLTTQHFSLNNNFTIEPRLSLIRVITDKQTISVAYGLHSRLENLNYYYNNSLETGEKMVNKNLDFTKAHHIVFSYDFSISELLHLKVEPYFQQLYDVPVMQTGSFSAINLQSDWFFAQKLVNNGEGRNFGIDVTLEKYMNNGFYYMFTASLFDSKYKDADGVWRDTRFNRTFVTNILAGKEWKVGKSKLNTFNINGRITIQGGERYTPFDVLSTSIKKEIVYDESKAFSEQTDAMLNLHFSVSHTKNKLKSSREIALKIVNLTQQPDFYGYQYNFRTGGIDKDVEIIMLPNICYKIQF
jgi:CarboxypepD_reg-like domain